MSTMSSGGTMTTPTTVPLLGERGSSMPHQHITNLLHKHCSPKRKALLQADPPAPKRHHAAGGYDTSFIYELIINPRLAWNLKGLESSDQSMCCIAIRKRYNQSTWDGLRNILATDPTNTTLLMTVVGSMFISLQELTRAVACASGDGSARVCAIREVVSQLPTPGPTPAVQAQAGEPSALIAVFASVASSVVGILADLGSGGAASSRWQELSVCTKALT